MSFGKGDFGGGSLSTSPGASSSSTMDYNRITQVVSANTTKIQNHVKEIKKLAEQVGTELDNSDVRTKIQQTQTTTKRLCQDTEKLLNELKGLPAPDSPAEKRERRITLTRLANNYSNALNDQQSNSSEGNSLIALDNGAGQAQLQQQLSPNEMAQMQDRENAIIQLEADIADVNMIFKDLATMVHDQGEIIDSIEQNIETAVVDIQSGNTQLRQAREHQQAARKKKFIIAIVFLIFILVLFLIIWFSWKTS
ncbi:Oidioi.mRNA.OKI2018_I69.XSR.g13363.t1.cds [Oikopleura dioica]|uniref:Oidioi.mRNA.OKI2018_I69.XSR.g13363.t1.cds n=1 Tax=Oikopleura dioica TaxID=34765 RepID=A0ABN7SDK7_OIKDI|nr:Oidioi.mRNA.OKI2018_I69.XSR.g13363.t1.cds [Oikopleura dioica]